jgi:HD superfamily phosphohydrolase YqeK
MPTTKQKKKLLKAKIAVVLHDELGRVPKGFVKNDCRAFKIENEINKS